MQCGRPVFFLIFSLIVSAASQAQTIPVAPASVAPATVSPTTVTPAPGQSSGYLFRNLDHTSGLLSNEVFSLAQDRKGYMWIGTGKGLQRYDGLRFRNYPDTSSADMENLKISDIFADDDHNRILYNQFYNSLKEWKLLDRQPSSLHPDREWRPGAAITYRDSKDSSWLLQTYFTEDKKNKGLALLKPPGNKPASFVFYIKDPQHQESWIFERTLGLLFLDDRNKRLSTPAEGPGNNALLQWIRQKPAGIRNINLDSHGNIWLVTWSPFFYRYNTTTRKLYTYSVPEIMRQQGTDPNNPGSAAMIMEDDHRRLWIGTAYAGLLEYHFEQDNFTYILHQPGNDQSLQYNHEIFSLFQDRDENIWLGTDKGISIFNPYSQYFTTISNQQPPPGQTPGSEIDCATEMAGGDLLVGTWGNGIRIYDSQLRPKGSIVFNDIHDKNLVWCFLNNEDGSVWAGCQHGYLHLIGADNRLIRTLHPAELENSTIRCMEKDSNGHILLGLHNGKIVTWDPRSGQFLPFSQPSSHPLFPILNIYIDKEGFCWAGTLNGLFEFDRKTRSFGAGYKPSPNMPLPFYGMTQYNDSVLLVGIGNAGLYLFHRRSRLFDKLPFRTEEPFGSAYAIAKDSTGNSWFTTDYDIGRYDPVEKKFMAYHPGKGVLSSSFTSCRFVILRSGKWLTWTSTEVVEFSPKEISAGQTAPAGVTITGLKVFDRSLFIDSFLYSGSPVRLSYKENFISIAYSALRFSGIAQTEYYYQLTGIDKDWVHAGPRGYANYTNLPPGKYTFRVRTGAAGNDSNTASMDLVIVPPFWETAWFRITCLLALAGLLYGSIRWRIRHIRRDAGLQQQIVTAEMMALRAQMNPHFIFNCINSIDALIQSNDKYQATMYLNKFARLIRNILDSSRQNSIPLTKDLETLRLYIELEQLRNGNTFTAEIKAEEEIIREDYKVPPLIVQPYVENAILHGLKNRRDSDGRLLIQVARHNGHLKYTIEDNGVGREASKKDQLHRSYGMEMSSNRVRLFNKQEQAPVTVTDLRIDGRAAGTRVQVLLKIQ